MAAAVTLGTDTIVTVGDSVFEKRRIRGRKLSLSHVPPESVHQVVDGSVNQVTMSRLSDQIPVWYEHITYMFAYIYIHTHTYKSASKYSCVQTPGIKKCHHYMALHVRT